MARESISASTAASAGCVWCCACCVPSGPLPEQHRRELAVAADQTHRGSGGHLQWWQKETIGAFRRVEPLDLLEQHFLERTDEPALNLHRLFCHFPREGCPFLQNSRCRVRHSDSLTRRAEQAAKDPRKRVYTGSGVAAEESALAEATSVAPRTTSREKLRMSLSMLCHCRSVRGRPGRPPPLPVDLHSRTRGLLGQSAQTAPR